MQRLYDMAAKASTHCFSNIYQHSVTKEVAATFAGQGAWAPVRDMVSRLGRDKVSLGMPNFIVQGDGQGCYVQRPGLRCARKTMAAAAHSSQVGYEECLLRLEFTSDGSVADWAPVAKSWACGLVNTVAAEAVGLQQPAVLADMVHSRVFLAVFNSGPALVGWPLEIVDAESGFMRLQQLQRPFGLEVLIVTDPCSLSQPHNDFHGLHVAMCVGVFALPREQIIRAPASRSRRNME